MGRRLRFDVFGREMLVERVAGAWAAFYPGPDGKRRRASIVIPACVDEAEMLQYLDDLLHESATERHPKVRRL